MRMYKSKPTSAICPDCSPPKRFPAPLISKSFNATCIPAPKSVLVAIVVRRSWANSEIGCSVGYRKYAYALSRLRPTRPLSWWSWDKPNRSERSTIRVFALGISIPLSIIVVQRSKSNSLFQNERITSSKTLSFICPCAIPIRMPGISDLIFSETSSILSTRLWM